MKKFKNSIRTLLAISAICIPLTSFAGPGWRGQANIIEVSVDYHIAGFAVKFDNAVSLNGCVSTNEVVVHRTLAGFKEAYSMVLMAYASKKKVNVWLDGTCYNNNARNVGIAFMVSD